MFCISISNWKQMKADFTLLLHLSLLAKYALMMLSSLQHDYCTVNNVCKNVLPQCWIIAFCNCHHNGPAGYYNQPNNVTKITAFTAEIVMKGRVNRFKAAGNKPPLHLIPASAHQWVVALCYCIIGKHTVSFMVTLLSFIRLWKDCSETKRRVCLVLRSWPYRELRKHLAVAVRRCGKK